MKPAAALLVTALLAHAVAAQGQSASLEGRVIARDTGAGIGGAHVELRLAADAERQSVTTIDTAGSAGRPVGAPAAVSSTSRVTTTGPDGSFSFRDVAAGQYRLYATRPNGYIPGEYGQRTPTGAGTTFSVTAGARVTAVSLLMTPTATINGRILDEGEPSGYAHVQALRATWRDGRRQLTAAQLVQADERGVYRLFWLPPGEYFVAAKPLDLRRSSEMLHIPPPSRFGDYEQQRRPTVTAINATRVTREGEVIESQYVPIYYPAARDESVAQPITVTAGQHLQGLDIDVAESLVRTQRVRGQVIDGTTGLPVIRASLEIIPRDAPAILLVSGGNTAPDGRFDLGGALPGANYLIVNGGAALVPIDVVAGADVNGLTVTVWPPVSIGGLIRTAAGDADPDVVSGISIALRRAPAVNGLRDPASGIVVTPIAPSGAATVRYSAGPISDAEGRFTLTGIRQGDYAIVAALRGDAYIESAQFGGRDVLRRPLRIDGPAPGRLDVVIGTDGASIGGTIVDASAGSVAGATVVLVPDQGRERIDLFKSAATDALGRFEMRGVAPGDYELFAWDHMEPGAWMDPEVLRMEEGRGQRIRAAAGARIAGAYRLIPRP
jgi:protocatechuate 3,4-dioxygenase beta subunit